jgi:hypothetical protein
MKGETTMRRVLNAQGRTRRLRQQVADWYAEYLALAPATDTGGVADSGSFIHDSGRGATRKAELPKLALAADGLAALGVNGVNTAGFRSLALELKTMGAPLSDTGAA